MLKKIDYTKNSLRNIEKIFSCPICKTKMFLSENSLKCFNNHCFDISRKGCISLLKNNKKRNDKIYDHLLFENRKQFINSLFYEKLHLLIANIINDKENSNIIVDMGCGDGTHDNKIYNLLKNKASFLLGIDLSNDGIVCSSEYVYNNFIPIIADLNDMPIIDKTVDVLLNILSPSTEKEMKRILKDDGIIIKVTPKKDYLIELRNALNVKDYENELVIEENIKKNYVIKEKHEINQKYDLSDKYLSHLIKMTPLSKNHEMDSLINEITIALNVYVLSPKV